MGTEGNLRCCKTESEILNINIHFSEQAELIFISLALCGFLLFSLLVSSALMGFCMATMTVTWASNLALTYSISSLTSNGWISRTVNCTPPLSWNYRLCLGGERIIPTDLKCSQLATTDSLMMIAQVMLSLLLKCKCFEAWPANIICSFHSAYPEYNFV